MNDIKNIPKIFTFFNSQKFLVIEPPADLLGSYLQYILYSYIICRQFNAILVLSNNTNLRSFKNFTEQKVIGDFNLVSNAKMETHLKNRLIFIKEFVNLKIRLPLKVKLKKYDLEYLLNLYGFEKLIIKYQKEIKEKLLKVINKNTNSNLNDENKKIIAIHFRSGEIVQNKNRYIHSSEYHGVISKLREKYPNYEFLIFSSGRHFDYIDDLETFNNISIMNNTDTLETLKYFLTAEILVCAKSSFSYLMALFREKETYYIKFWHQKLSNWYSWESCLKKTSFDFSEKNIFHIIGGKYIQIPKNIINNWKDIFQDYKYFIFNDNNAFKFLKIYYDSNTLNHYFPANSKWKADLLRFCIMSKIPGIYSDVDQKPTNLINNLPNYDTIMVLGAHTKPKVGIKPLPNGEIHIGFIKCLTPDSIFMEFIKSIGIEKVISGEPYSINIQGLYSFLCKRWNIEEILPFKVYTDPKNNRTYYFLKEIRKEKKYIIENKEKELVIHSQFYNNNLFF